MLSASILLEKKKREDHIMKMGIICRERGREEKCPLPRNKRK
jgi:hypothetical protein